MITSSGIMMNNCRALRKQLAQSEGKRASQDDCILDLENQLSAAERRVEGLTAGNQAAAAQVACLQAELAQRTSDLEAREWRIEDLAVQVHGFTRFLKKPGV